MVGAGRGGWSDAPGFGRHEGPGGLEGLDKRAESHGQTWLSVDGWREVLRVRGLVEWWVMMDTMTVRSRSWESELSKCGGRSLHPGLCSAVAMSLCGGALP